MLEEEFLEILEILKILFCPDEVELALLLDFKLRKVSDVEDLLVKEIT